MDVRPIPPLPTSRSPPDQKEPAAVPQDLGQVPEKEQEKEEENGQEHEQEHEQEPGLADAADPLLDIASLLPFLTVDREPSDPESLLPSHHNSSSIAGSPLDTGSDDEEQDAAAADDNDDDNDNDNDNENDHDNDNDNANDDDDIHDDGHQDEDDGHSWMTHSDTSLLKDLGCDLESEPCDKTKNGHSISRLPKGTHVVKFVGEGTANAVFEISVPPDSPAKDRVKGKLLRVAKVALLGQTPTYDYPIQHSFYTKVIKPMLGEYAVHQELAILHNSGVIDQINALLKDNDDTRKPRFRGSFVGNSNWGLLVEDMRPGEDNTHMLIEFKPKWLLQSPSAPKKAIRCRQCALDLRKFVLNPNPEKPRPSEKPCPLALGRPWAPDAVRSPFRIANALPGIAMAEHRLEAALAQVMDHDVIHLLRREQDRLDKKGPLHASPTDQIHSLAMTIRDLTLFALVPIDDSSSSSSSSSHSHGDAPIKVRLCDFDWKDPKFKAKRWAATERALIEEGFYTADWLLCRVDGTNTYYHPPTLCALEYTRHDPSLGIFRGLDFIALEEDLGDRSTDGKSVRSLDLRSRVGTGSQVTVYAETMDRSAILALKEALTEFKKEPEGTPQDALYNPLRPFLI